MRKEDPDLKLIGWGDAGDKFRPDDTWTRKMSAVDGIDLIAFHHHFDSGLPDSPLIGTEYRNDPDKTWLHLMNAYKSLEIHIEKMRADCGNKRLAMTEGHYNLPGRNRNEVLSTWGAGVSYARCLNVIHRNSDVIDIATMADFFGVVWQVNAIMLAGRKKGMFAYFQPVATVMCLFGNHQGQYALDITAGGTVDAVASRTGDTVYVHMINTDCHNPASCQLSIPGEKIRSVKMYSVSENIMTEVTMCNPNVFAIREETVVGDTVVLKPGAVAALEIELDSVKNN